MASVETGMDYNAIADRVYIEGWALALTFAAVDQWLSGSHWTAVVCAVMSAICQFAVIKWASWLKTHPDNRFFRTAHEVSTNAKWWVATLIAFLFYLSLSPLIPLSERLLPQTSMLDHGTTSSEEGDKSIASIRSERDHAIAERDAALANVRSLTEENASLRQMVSALQIKNDSLRFEQSTTPAQHQTIQDIGAHISSWKSLSKQLSALNTELNEGDGLVAWLEGGAKDDKYSIDHFSRIITERRQSLNALRNAFFAYKDISSALEQVQISGGRPPVPGTIFDSLLRSLNDVSAQLSADQETKEPYVHSFKADLGVTRDWAIRTKQLADSQAAALAKEQPN